MHKLYEYACDELKELEKKADKGLSAAELEYADRLTELKKNILKIEMLEGGSEYSGRYYDPYRRSYDDHGESYARGRNAKRDAMGRYSRAADDVVEQLEAMMDSAPNDMTRKKIKDLINEMRNV